MEKWYKYVSLKQNAARIVYSQVFSGFYLALSELLRDNFNEFMTVFIV